MTNQSVTLRREENQARGLGRLAIDFLAGRLGEPDESVLRRVELFHLDSIACSVSAIACGTSAPSVLRAEALDYTWPRLSERQMRVSERLAHVKCHSGRSEESCGVPLLGSSILVMPEKAVVANCAAAREWDANGTNFGYNPARGHRRGEFGHNDYYPVAVAAAQQRGLDGRQTLRAMLLLDEIRGRLAEVFALKDHKIDHVVHGAIASAVVYGAVLGATPEQIESALGLLVAHYVPFRAIRAGHQLSDSKGASAAISSEMAVLSVHRAMRGFVGPRDIFRNPQAIFCLFEPPGKPHTSPFDLTLSTAGDDFAVMGMHFKLGLYEHQSAGAIQGLMELLAARPELLGDPGKLTRMRIDIYEPAFSIIGDPHKRDPHTRQSADHSMVYIIGTLLRKAYAWRAGAPPQREIAPHPSPLPRREREKWQAADLWRELILLPDDYSDSSLIDPLTRSLMERIEFRHGGPDYDAKYPDGIPTSLEIEHTKLGTCSSGLVMYPEGHARNTSGHLDDLLTHKVRRLAALGVRDVDALMTRFSNLAEKSAEEIGEIYDFELLCSE